MIILPAVDIIDGMPVRLYQGDYSRSEVVASSVSGTLQEFDRAGAPFVHIVDLDGARRGEPVNAGLITDAVSRIGVPAEVGGGIRSLETIAFYLEHGVRRVILGTAAVQDEAMLKEALERYGSGIAVGLDCRDGMVRTAGWLEGTSVHYLDFAKHLEQLGVRNIICTDISRDGTLTGPNVEMLKALKDTVNIDITASGGMHHIDDIRRLKELGLYGAIIGKALYSGAISLKEALAETGGAA